MTEAAIRRRYTEIADIYIRMFGAVEHVDPEDLGFLERNLGECEGTVLDAGCGPGHLTAYLTNLGLAATGIDLVPEFIDSARAIWPEVDFAVGSMHKLDIPDRSLSGILAWYSLIHCEPAAGLAAVLTEFHRTMSRGGTLVVGFFEGGEVAPFDHKVTTAYRWPADEMSRMLSMAGFVEVDRLRRPGTDRIRPHAALAACAK
ncbi:class I SAM-dependent methyltransferase [Mycobacterium sp. URHB0021]